MAAHVVTIAPTVASAFRRGERDAFLTVYDACAPMMRTVAARFFPRAFDREEALQEIWLLAFRSAGTYDVARGELWPWLRMLAVNRCKELLRARGRRPEGHLVDGVAGNAGGAVEDTITPQMEQVEGRAFPNPERAVSAEQVRAAVAAFAATLDPEERQVFVLSLVEEMTHAEVAAATKLSARRCKYLRMKLLIRASRDPGLAAALGADPGPANENSAATMAESLARAVAARPRAKEKT